MNIDLPLDDIIKKQRRANRGGRRFGDRSNQSRRYENHAENVCIFANQNSGRWMRNSQSSRSSQTKKILISNLSYAVNDADIAELFSECGGIKKSMVNYDSSGRSHGTAEVIYYRREDAETAIKRYNNVNLDSRPMKIEYVTINNKPEKRSFNGRPSTRPQSHFRDRRSWRKFGPTVRGQKPQNIRQNQGSLTTEDLDAQLEAYRRAAEGEAI